MNNELKMVEKLCQFAKRFYDMEFIVKRCEQHDSDFECFMNAPQLYNLYERGEVGPVGATWFETHLLLEAVDLLKIFNEIIELMELELENREFYETEN